MTETFKIDRGTRERVLACCLDAEWYKRQYEVILPENFELEREQDVAEALVKFYAKYDYAPTEGELLAYVGDAGTEVLELISRLYAYDPEKLKYAADNASQFVKDRSIKKALIAGVELYEAGKYGDVLSLFEAADRVGISATGDWAGCASTMLDVRDYDPTARRYLVEDLISERSSVCFYGEPKSLKTMIVWDLAVCLHLGKPWLRPADDAEDISTIKTLKTIQSNVLIVDLENGKDTLLERFKAFAEHYDMTDEELAGIPYVSIPRPIFDVELLVGMIEKHDSKVVIIDPLLKAAIDAVKLNNENDNAQMQMMVNIFDDVIERTGVTIIAIHHASKGGDLRGASALRGGVHTIYKIIRTAGQMPLVQVEYDASRYAAVDSFSAEFKFERYETRHLKSCHFDGIPDEATGASSDKAAWAKKWLWDNRQSLDERMRKDIMADLLKAAEDAEQKMTVTPALATYGKLIDDGRFGFETVERGSGSPRMFHLPDEGATVRKKLQEANKNKPRKGAKESSDE